MQEFLSSVIFPALFAFLGVAGTKAWDWIKPKAHKDIEEQEVLLKRFETEVKSAEFYRSLLDDAERRIEQAVKYIEQRDDRIDLLIKKVDTLTKELEDRDARIDFFIKKVDGLTQELEKYKQLNGKTA
jgi:N-glycosylase/DNA lyase